MCKDKAPAGAPQLEITPEMIAEGVRILVDHYDAIGGLGDEAVAADIFRAMMSKKEL